MGMLHDQTEALQLHSAQWWQFPVRKVGALYLDHAPLDGMGEPPGRAGPSDSG